MSKKFT